MLTQTSPSPILLTPPPKKIKDHSDKVSVIDVRYCCAVREECHTCELKYELTCLPKVHPKLSFFLFVSILVNCIVTLLKLSTNVKMRDTMMLKLIV